MSTRPLSEEPARAAFARNLSVYLVAVEDLLRARLRVEAGELLSVGVVERAEAALAEAIREASIHADVIGRRDLLREARALGAKPAAVARTPVPDVGFPQAVADIMSRDVVVARSAREVAEAYGERYVFGLARASSATVAAKAQDLIAATLHRGDGVVQGVRALVDLAAKEGQDWSRAYAEMALRTNTTTAYTAGRFRQMADADVRAAIGALELVTAGDVDVRPNHAAADGLIAAPEDPVWHELATPLGYSCRCQMRLVGWPELRRRRLVDANGEVRAARIPRGAFADPGFRHGGRPDLAIYVGR